MKSHAGPGSTPFLLLLAGLVLVGALAWVPTALGVWHDDGVYLLLGRALAEGEGLRYLGVSGAPPAPKFPPLFPAVLAGVWKLVPEFPGNTPYFQMVNLGILVVAGALFYGYARRALGLPVPVALSGTAVAWLSPGLWSLAVIPLSEPLFLLFLVLCLWAATAAEEADGGGAGAMALFLGAFALAFHTRTVGVAVAVGAVGGLLWAGRRGRAAVAAVGAGLIASPWLIWSGRAGEAVPESLRGTLGGYGDWLLRGVLEAPGAFGLQLVEGAGLLTRQLVYYMTPGGPGWLRWSVGALILPLLVVGLIRLGSRSRATVWVLLAYLGMIWVWPFRGGRFLVPVLPWAVLAVVAGAWTFLESPHSPADRWVRRVVPAVAGLWGVLFVGISAWALASGRHGHDYQVRSQALETAVGAVTRRTPPDAVVGAPELWAALHLYTGRTVSPSAHFVAVGGAGPTWGTPTEQYRLWRDGGVDHILAEQGGRIHGEALGRLDEVCPGGAVTVLEITRGQILVRLAWDGACRRRLGLEEG